MTKPPRTCADCGQPCDRRATRCRACANRQHGDMTAARAAEMLRRKQDRALAAKARELGITAD